MKKKKKKSSLSTTTSYYEVVWKFSLFGADGARVGERLSHLSLVYKR